MLVSYILKILVQKNQKDATHIKKYTLMSPICKMKELLTKRGKKTWLGGIFLSPNITF